MHLPRVTLNPPKNHFPTVLKFLKPPPPTVVLLPDTQFFVRTIPVPDAQTPEDVAAQVELALEASAPFPISQMYYGHCWQPGARHALAYAAYRKRFNSASVETWPDADAILTFAAPNIIDKAGTGDSYNLNQSLISVGSGGLAGKGWRQGTQAQLGYLPPAISHNDFIVSVIAEEKGFLGSLTVISLFGIILFNSIRIAGLARDRFGTLIAIGVTMFFTVHVFVNIAMSIGLVPITGIPLPFISYGGSFVLSCCLLQGLVQSVYRFRRDFS